MKVKTIQIQVRVTPDEFKRLVLYCHKHDITISRVIRTKLGGIINEKKSINKS